MKTKSLYPIITTSDLGKTVDFYCNVLDYSVKHDFQNEKGAHVMVFSNEKDDEIEIIEILENGPIKFEDGLYGLRMNIENMDDAVAELKEKGCKIISGPFETEMGRNLFIEDSNGVKITLIEHEKMEKLL